MGVKPCCRSKIRRAEYRCNMRFQTSVPFRNFVLSFVLLILGRDVQATTIGLPVDPDVEITDSHSWDPETKSFTYTTKIKNVSGHQLGTERGEGDEKQGSLFVDAWPKMAGEVEKATKQFNAKGFV